MTQARVLYPVFNCLYLTPVKTVEAMFGYMTELDKVEIDESQTVEFEVEGRINNNVCRC